MQLRKNYLVLTISTFILTLLSLTSCTPFLQNAPSAFVNFAASALASSQPQPYTNIADLRRRHEKAQQMESKYAEDENAIITTSKEELNTNEVTPNIFQKKLTKILTKLRLISELSKVFVNSRENENNDTSLQMRNETESTAFQDNVETGNDISNVTSSENREEVENIQKQTLQKTIYRTNNVPIKFTFDIKEANVNEENDLATTETKSEEQANRFGPVGVFLAEIFGSVVALAYGAAIQLNHLLQPTIEPPPA